MNTFLCALAYRRRQPHRRQSRMKRNIIMSDTSQYPFDEFTSHGLLQAELRVLDHLPPSLAQGIFSKAACYPAVVRLSSAPLLRGMAVKVTVPDGGRMAQQ